MDLQEGALAVVPAGEDMGLFYGAQVFLKQLDGLFDIGCNRLLVLFCQIDENMEVFPEGGYLFPVGQDPAYPGTLRLQLTRLSGVLPDIGVGEDRF
jgi:hypothetical protein